MKLLHLLNPLIILLFTAIAAASAKNFTLSARFNLTQGTMVYGNASTDTIGYLTESIGDFNGDGIDDFVITRNDASPLNYNHAGSIYVIYGQRGGFSSNIDLRYTLLPSQGFRIIGITGSQAGWSTAPAGDFNADGLADIIFGGDLYNPTAHPNSGSACIIYGKRGTSTTQINLNTGLANSVGTLFYGATRDWIGLSVSSAGDINNDGVSDILIGAISASPNGRSNAGLVYVIYGGSQYNNINSVDLSQPFTASQGFKVYGGYSGDNLGYLTAPVGDFNHDGIADFLVGSPNIEPLNRPDAGAAYVIYGSRSFTNVNIDLNYTLSVSQGLQIYGAMPNDGIGSVATRAGDFNGDGIDDIIFGCPDMTVLGRTSGMSFIVFGQRNRQSAVLDLRDNQDFTQVLKIYGAANGNYFGFSVNYLKDINSDGIDDVVIGAPYAAALPSTPARAGTVYVIYGQKGPFSSNLDMLNMSNSTQGYMILGNASYGYFGYSVAGHGDYNADQLPDILALGYYYPVLGRGYTGAVIMLYTTPPPASYTASKNSSNISAISDSDFDYANVINIMTNISSAFVMASSVLSPTDPGGLSATVLTRLLQLSKLLKVSHNRQLQTMMNNTKITTGFLFFAPNMPTVWESRLINEAMPSAFIAYNVPSKFVVGFWKGLMSFAIVLAIYLPVFILSIILRIKAPESAALSIARKSKIIIENFMLTQLYSSYGDIVMYSILDFSTVISRSIGSVMSIIMAAIFLMLGALTLGYHFWLILQYQTIKRKFMAPQTRQAVLKKFSQDHKAAQVLFIEFKDASLKTQGFMIVQVIASILFSVILTVLYHHPLAQSIVLVIICVIIFLYSVILRPFSQKVNSLQCLVIEIILLVVYSCLLSMADMDADSKVKSDSWDALNMTIIACNLVAACVVPLFGVIKAMMFVFEHLTTMRHKRKQERAVERVQNGSFVSGNDGSILALNASNQKNASNLSLIQAPARSRVLKQRDEISIPPDSLDVLNQSNLSYSNSSRNTKDLKSKMIRRNISTVRKVENVEKPLDNTDHNLRANKFEGHPSDFNDASSSSSYLWSSHKHNRTGDASLRSNNKHSSIKDGFKDVNHSALHDHHKSNSFNIIQSYHNEMDNTVEGSPGLSVRGRRHEVDLNIQRHGDIYEVTNRINHQ